MERPNGMQVKPKTIKIAYFYTKRLKIGKRIWCLLAKYTTFGYPLNYKQY